MFLLLLGIGRLLILIRIFLEFRLSVYWMLGECRCGFGGLWVMSWWLFF